MLRRSLRYPSMPSSSAQLIGVEEPIPRRRGGCVMRRLFSCGLGLALAMGGFAGVARAQFKSGGQAVELRLPTVSQRALSTQRIRVTHNTLNYFPPLVGGPQSWGKAV